MGVIAVVASGGGGGGGGGGGDQGPGTGTRTITGTAAAGAPVVGVVNVRGADGKTSSSRIESDGTFTVDVTALTAPFVVWVSGSANGRSVKLYSTIDTPGNCNVTTTSHAVMAMALGTDPVEHYGANPDAVPPGAADIEAAKQVIQNLLSQVFNNLGLTNFDIMNGRFVADGKDNFDVILDAIEVEVDGAVVEIKDSATGAQLLKATGGNVDRVQDPDGVADLIDNGMIMLDQFKAGFKALEALYATGKPSPAALSAWFDQYAADDILDDGFNKAQLINQWSSAGSDYGPPVGIQFVSVSIYRAMTDNLSIAGKTHDELNGYPAGYWCVSTFQLNGMTDAFLSCFVKDGTAWKWYGDRTSIADSPDCEAEAYQDIRSGGTIYTSGLDFNAEDEFNSAPDIVALGIVNPVLPSGGLVLQRANPPHSHFFIPGDSDNLYSFADGLDASKLTDPEFIIAGIDASGGIVNAWIELQQGEPIDTAVLAANPHRYFPTITGIGGQAPSHNLPLRLGEGPVFISWENPSEPGCIPDGLSAWLYGGNDWESQWYDNPAEWFADVAPTDWTELMVDGRDFSLPVTPEGGGIEVEITVPDRSQFTTRYHFTLSPTDPVDIQMTGGYLQYRTFSDPNRDNYRGWVTLDDGGKPIIIDDITDFRILDSQQNEITINAGDGGFSSDAYIFGHWNASAQSVTYGAPYIEYGIWFGLPGGKDYSAGTYTYEAVTVTGTVNLAVAFPGKTALPVVDAATMNASWTQAGDLNLSWNNPAGDYDQIRVIVGNYLFIRLPAGKSSVTVPKAIIDRLKLMFRADNRWYIQLRKYENGMNCARSVSAVKQINNWYLF